MVRKSNFKRSNGKKSTAAKAEEALKLAKGLMSQVELKGIEIGGSGSASPDFVPLNLYPYGEGISENGRIGEKIQPAKLTLSYQLSHNPSGANVQLCRVMVVRDTQQIESTPPTMTQMFGSATGNEVDQLIHTKRSRWNVLYDRTHILQGEQAGSTYKTYALVKEAKIKVTGKALHYIGSGAANVERNGLWLVYKTQQGTVTNPPTFIHEFQALFTDA